MTEEELNASFETYPHADLVKAVYMMKSELMDLYELVAVLADTQKIHSQVLVRSVAGALVDAEVKSAQDITPHPGMYL